jgi:hypothetical protein
MRLRLSIAVLGIRDILVRIRIPGSVPLTTGSEVGSGSAPDPTPDPTLFFIDFKDTKNIFFSYFFLLTCRQAHLIRSKNLLLLKFGVIILFCRHYFSPPHIYEKNGRIWIRTSV